MKCRQVKGWIGLMMAAMMAVTGCGSKNTAEVPSDSVTFETVVESESSSELTEKLDYVKLKGVAIGDPTEASDVFLTRLNEMLLRDLNCELEIEYISWMER